MIPIGANNDLFPVVCSLDCTKLGEEAYSQSALATMYESMWRGLSKKLVLLIVLSLKKKYILNQLLPQYSNQYGGEGGKRGGGGEKVQKDE